MRLGIVALVAVLYACGSAPQASSPQLPPITGQADLEAWFQAGHYRAWHCEATPHQARPPSPHLIDRICSNDIVSRAGTGEYPMGAASVKEVFDDGGSMAGFAVTRRLHSGPSVGSWYFFDRNRNTVLADGTGDNDRVGAACTSCHSLAGSDASYSGHDFVYTQVQ